MAKGQSIGNLDVRGGFKGIKIGDSLTNWSEKIISIGNNSSSGKTVSNYKLKNPQDYKLFNYSISEIILSFYNKKVVSITVSTVCFQEIDTSGKTYQPWRTDDFTSINSSFESLFGEASGITADDKTGQVSAQWIAEKIMLLSIYFPPSKYCDYQKIIISDLAFLVSTVSDGF